MDNNSIFSIITLILFCLSWLFFLLMMLVPLKYGDKAKSDDPLAVVWVLITWIFLFFAWKDLKLVAFSEPKNGIDGLIGISFVLGGFFAFVYIAFMISWFVNWSLDIEEYGIETGRRHRFFWDSGIAEIYYDIPARWYRLLMISCTPLFFLANFFHRKVVLNSNLRDRIFSRKMTKKYS